VPDSADGARNTPSSRERFLRLDLATLYEAAGQQGMVDPGIRPAWPGATLCGPALTVQCPPGDNLMLHQAVATASPGNVIVADAGGYLRAGAWGEILTTAALARGLAGLVIDGAVRDIGAVAALGFPIFSRGLAIGGCTKKLRGALNHDLCVGGVMVRPRDIVVGGAEGVLVIAAERAEAVYRAALERHQREQALMQELRAGKTTMDLLGLRRYFEEGKGEP
jgi:4-hydroxy-4-methyl-2-oxoglutarate aldolase